MEFLEICITTRVYPPAYEELVQDHFKSMGWHVISVCHAVVGEDCYIKIQTLEAPPFNVVLSYDQNTTVKPRENKYKYWTVRDTETYLMKHSFQEVTVSDEKEIKQYFRGEHWKTYMNKGKLPEIEHFHIYLESKLNPKELEKYFIKAIEEAGYTLNTACRYISRPDIDTMFISFTPTSSPSFEVALKYDPQVTLKPKDLTPQEKAYGGEGWTKEQTKKFIDKYPWKKLSKQQIFKVRSTILDFHS